MGSGQQLQFALRIATAVVPVAVYFLVLGLLNSRRHPQMLSARLDFGLLWTAMSPLFVVPALHVVGVSVASVLLAAIAIAAGAVSLAPRGHRWVVYNATPSQAHDAVAWALQAIHPGVRRVGGTLTAPDGEFVVEVTEFPILRNVSICFRGPEDLSKRFAEALGGTLTGMSAETAPSTVALLLVATGMLVAPLAMMANQAGQIARLLTGLLQ
jgi:hypothetical protein